MTAALIEAMRAEGLKSVSPLKLVDGKLERFQVVGDKAWWRPCGAIASRRA